MIAFDNFEKSVGNFHTNGDEQYQSDMILQGARRSLEPVMEEEFMESERDTPVLKSKGPALQGSQSPHEKLA